MMWALHHATLTIVGDGGPDVTLRGYNVQDMASGQAQAVGTESVTAASVRVSGPLTNAVREGQTVVHDGVVYEVSGRVRDFRGGALDHVEFTLVERFPSRWLTDVTVRRSGRSDRGHPLPPVEILVSGCLVRWRSTEEAVDRTDLTSGTATLYRRRRAGDDFAFRSTDAVEVPEGSLVPGRWAVDGEPKHWPFSVEVQLTKG